MGLRPLNFFPLLATLATIFLLRGLSASRHNYYYIITSFKMVLLPLPKTDELLGQSFACTAAVVSGQIG
jgi:hypothetical protein